MKNILIVEDDLSLAQGIQLTLKESERAFAHCTHLAHARHALSAQRYDLIILDVSLPDGSGLAFCREIRPTFPNPILFLTANDTELDVVSGLESGGDDYITKPFSLAILRARVNALLRRNNTQPTQLQFQDLILDFERLAFSKGGVPIELSKTEQRVLHILTMNPGQVLTRERLLDYAWADSGAFVDENALSVTISRLRSKLEGSASDSKFIKTVRGIGYCWMVQP